MAGSTRLPWLQDLPFGRGAMQRCFKGGGLWRAAYLQLKSCWCGNLLLLQWCLDETMPCSLSSYWRCQRKGQPTGKVASLPSDILKVPLWCHGAMLLGRQPCWEAAFDAWDLLCLLCHDWKKLSYGRFEFTLRNQVLLVLLAQVLLWSHGWQEEAISIESIDVDSVWQWCGLIGDALRWHRLATVRSNWKYGNSCLLF